MLKVDSPHRLGTGAFDQRNVRGDKIGCLRSSSLDRSLLGVRERERTCSSIFEDHFEVYRNQWLILNYQHVAHFLVPLTYVCLNPSRTP